MVEVKVLKSVAHGIYDLHKHEIITLPVPFAAQLRAHGFVAYDDTPADPAASEAKQAAPVDNKMLDAPENKEQAAWAARAHAEP